MNDNRTTRIVAVMAGNGFVQKSLTIRRPVLTNQDHRTLGWLWIVTISK
jgi:hypothetical protein